MIVEKLTNSFFYNFVLLNFLLWYWCTKVENLIIETENNNKINDHVEMLNTQEIRETSENCKFVENK